MDRAGCLPLCSMVDHCTSHTIYQVDCDESWREGTKNLLIIRKFIFYDKLTLCTIIRFCYHGDKVWVEVFILHTPVSLHSALRADVFWRMETLE